MEIIRTIAVFAGWGLTAVAALFVVGVLVMFFLDARKKDQVEGGKASKSSAATTKREKPGRANRAKNLVTRGETVTKQEATSRILGGESNAPLPPQQSNLNLPTALPQTTAPADTATPAVLKVTPVTIEDGQGSAGSTPEPFIRLPNVFPEPPKL